MTGIKPGSSCIVSNRSANCATATAWNGFIFNLRFASMDKLKAVSSNIALSINRSVNNQSGGGGLFTKTFVLSIGRFDEISFDEISLNKSQIIILGSWRKETSRQLLDSRQRSFLPEMFRFETTNGVQWQH